ncbi:inhibin alpha chain [Pseudochaenichthys georgianus]|uniref:inhibin alpha chain n=1 Tax=Pseudochaenichthys georgianus TaxID=52239 RepID=UPI00146DDD69|nr:inhibin alpha chain [Pseudochaenichthys georgianus]
MVSCALFILGPLWVHILGHACSGEDLSREEVLSWVRVRVLEGLRLEEPPLTPVQAPDRDPAPQRALRASRTTWVQQQSSPTQETSEIILFPNSDSSCARSDSAETASSHFTYYFQPSMNSQETSVTSAHFWFYAGEGATNSSAQLFMVTSAQQLHQAAEAPSKTSSDGWMTFDLEQDNLASVAEGPFLLQVRCPACQCSSSEPDYTPFLHLHAQPRGPARSPRSVTIPWSPAAVELLKRPSVERLGDCTRAEVQISFEELGWDSWIVHPKALTFYYCQGNCSAEGRTATMLGIKQCCAPVPGTMRSLRITTTSDGGYTFNYETLPNIMPEECTCM